MIQTHPLHHTNTILYRQLKTQNTNTQPPGREGGRAGERQDNDTTPRGGGTQVE